MAGDLADIFNDEEDSQIQPQTSISTSDLDPFLLQGDEQTWAMEDWNWDPFNMFAAPKEVPQVACCQALKRRKAAGEEAATGTSALAAGLAAQQQQQARHACCHGAQALGSHQPQAPAAACCGISAMSGLPEVAMPQALASMPTRVVETCQPNLAMHAAAAMGMPAALAAGGPGLSGGGASGGWGQMPDFASAAAGGLQYFPSGGLNQFTGSTGSMAAAAMMWGAQAQAMAQLAPMPAMPAMASYPAGGIQQCAPSVPMHPAFNMPNPNAPFMQHASNALPSPGLGSSADTAMSLQHHGGDGKAHSGSGNGQVGSGAAPAACCGGAAPRGVKRTDSANHGDSTSNKQPPAKNPRRAAAEDAFAGLLSDVDASDSEDDGDGGRGGNARPAVHHGDVVVLHDNGEEMACQVPGCGKDLSGLKEYHQRYRICDVHIKLQQVIKDGRLQRFCQQCGRFHDLTAFDGNRKSCRDQLSKHNARRRRRAQAEQAKGAKGGADLPSLPMEGDVGKLLATLMQNPVQLHALRLLLGVSTHPALPATASSSPAVAPEAAEPGGSEAAADARSYSVARDMLSCRGEFAPAFESEHRTVRLSMKLFNKTPADLPHDMRNQVTSWLASAPAALEATIRPGCVFLTAQMLVDEAVAKQTAAPGALPSFVQHLLQRTGCPFWSSGMYTVQLNGEMMMVRDGGASAVTGGPCSGADRRQPAVVRLGPMAIASGQASTLKLVGHNLDAPGCQAVIRWGGSHVKCALEPISSHRAIVNLPPLPEAFCGVAWVEVARGAYLSPAKPLLVAHDEAMVAEINNLDVRRGPMRIEAVDCLLVDLGLVMQHIAGIPSVAAALPHASISLKARRLLATACDMGWAAVANAVLPLACAACSCAAEMVAAIHASTSSADGSEGPGLSLLHRAVRSGSVALLSGMLAWGDAHGYRWRVDSPGPCGITPLHMCAMLDDMRPALLLLDHCGWPAAFTQLRTYDGVTPFHLAFQMGHYQVDNILCSLRNQVQHPLHVVDANNGGGANNNNGAPPAAPRQRSRCGSNHAPPANDAAGHDDDDAPTELDPCEVCQCTLPPLLLSIMASCNDCGRRRHCVEAEGGSCSCGHARPTLKHDRGEVCSLEQHSTIYSITALCQGCHANRVLAVA